MPYIKCPDGKTYSTYNKSEYVQWCICHDKEVKEQQWNDCMSDPKCKQEYEYNTNKGHTIVCCLALTAALIIGFIGYKMMRELKC